MSKDPGYSDSRADRQGSQVRELERKLDLASVQIEGLILCLQEHGTNLNVPFLIEHYTGVLNKIKDK